ncbi:MAG: tectonin domain-containing protein, partial [Terriglobales bacterium]
YDPATGDFNISQGFVHQIAAGGDGVWLLDTSDNIWRFDSSREAFVEVTGPFKNISVGSGAGVFAVNSSGAVFTFVRP